MSRPSCVADITCTARSSRATDPSWKYGAVFATLRSIVISSRTADLLTRTAVGAAGWDTLATGAGATGLGGGGGGTHGGVGGGFIVGHLGDAIVHGTLTSATTATPPPPAAGHSVTIRGSSHLHVDLDDLVLADITINTTPTPREKFAALRIGFAHLGRGDALFRRTRHPEGGTRDAIRAAYNAAPVEYEGLTVTPVGIDGRYCPPELLAAARAESDRMLELGSKTEATIDMRGWDRAASYQRN